MKKPILLVIMDGVGFSKTGLGDAVTMANTPTLDHFLANYPSTKLKAHGTAVGLPSDDDMGNSEVGHNALGCGQVYSQGAKLVNESIDSGKIYESETWLKVVENVKANNSTLHFMGLLSDGNVHSNISHLLSMLKASKAQGVSKVRVHIMLDGRDVPATSALTYVDQLENTLAELNDAIQTVKKERVIGKAIHCRCKVCRIASCILFFLRSVNFIILLRYVVFTKGLRNRLCKVFIVLVNQGLTKYGSEFYVVVAKLGNVGSIFRFARRTNHVVRLQITKECIVRALTGAGRRTIYLLILTTRIQRLASGVNFVFLRIVIFLFRIYAGGKRSYFSMIMVFRLRLDIIRF